MIHGFVLVLVGLPLGGILTIAVFKLFDWYIDRWSRYYGW